MSRKVVILAMLALTGAMAAHSQEVPAGGQANAARGNGPMGPVKTDRYHVNFVRLGSNRINGLMYEPEKPAPNARIALVYSYPRPSAFDGPAAEMASRGYRVLLVRHYMGSRRGEVQSPLDGSEETSRGIAYLRTLPGVERVVVMGWGQSVTHVSLYESVAEHGPAACQRPEVLSPCKAEQASNLTKPDGVVFFDPGPGPLTVASNVDPAVDVSSRKADLDMFAAANGYDAMTGTAKYSSEFSKRFFAAQSARNMQIINNAVARLKAVQQGKGRFTDSEPFTVAGAVNVRARSSLHRTDTTLLSRTKRPHTLLKADGTKPQVIVQSVRTPTGIDDIKSLGRCCEQINYTVHEFLTNDAVRTTGDFALTEDDMVGVDWKSSNAAPPANAEGINVPALVITQTCFQFVVPSEIFYDHLASKDKTFAAVEGGEHFFTPCKPEYGDTKKRTFDFVDQWLTKTGRF